jgi:hypothetical protein
VQPSADRVKEEVKLENLADVPLIISHTMHRIRPNEAARLGLTQHIALKIDADRSIVDQVEGAIGSRRHDCTIGFGE